MVVASNSAVYNGKKGAATRTTAPPTAIDLAIANSLANVTGAPPVGRSQSLGGNHHPHGGKTGTTKKSPLLSPSILSPTRSISPFAGGDGLSSYNSPWGASADSDNDDNDHHSHHHNIPPGGRQDHLNLSVGGEDDDTAPSDGQHKKKKVRAVKQQPAHKSTRRYVLGVTLQESVVDPGDSDAPEISVKVPPLRIIQRFQDYSVFAQRLANLLATAFWMQATQLDIELSLIHI
eukprot:TRINITY_DN9101_c0_g1_i2.p1 TRINITY_DN9101_c0_g1~~TRINITY_DN9101_c0_g1_i2.p1  ORF type:complete len:233 (+),score=40.43 TRINITY_DN9101_c0_g1_i2:338-1036(+)